MANGIANLVLILSVFLSFDSFAASVDEAKTAYENALIQYHLETKALSNPTPQQMQQLEDRIVGPARAGFNHARVEEQKRVIDEAVKESIAKDKANIASGKSQSQERRKSGKSTLSSKGITVAPSRQRSTGIERIEYQIDGSSIPKEIEFTKTPSSKGSELPHRKK